MGIAYPAHSRLVECVKYDPVSGIFTCRAHQPRSKFFPGDAMGSVISSGYVQIYIDGVSYLAHRLAWLYETGSVPDGDIDHRDLVRTHNWFSNLREATRVQNISNQPVRVTNTSGFKGVSFNKQKGKFQARIRVNGRRLHLGFFEDAASAGAAYDIAASHHHGEFAYGR